MIEDPLTVPQSTESDFEAVHIPAPRSGHSYELYLTEVLDYGVGCLDAPLS
jgi:hypothetical protein